MIEKKLLKYFFCSFAFFCSNFVNAQNAENQLKDSLEYELKITKQDTTRCNILSELSEICELDDI